MATSTTAATDDDDFLASKPLFCAFSSFMRMLFWFLLFCFVHSGFYFTSANHHHRFCFCCCCSCRRLFSFAVPVHAATRLSFAAFSLIFDRLWFVCLLLFCIFFPLSMLQCGRLFAATSFFSYVSHNEHSTLIILTSYVWALAESRISFLLHSYLIWGIARCLAPRTS